MWRNIREIAVRQDQGLEALENNPALRFLKTLVPQSLLDRPLVLCS